MGQLTRIGFISLDALSPESKAAMERFAGEDWRVGDRMYSELPPIGKSAACMARLVAMGELGEQKKKPKASCATCGGSGQIRQVVNGFPVFSKCECRVSSEHRVRCKRAGVPRNQIGEELTEGSPLASFRGFDKAARFSAAVLGNKPNVRMMFRCPGFSGQRLGSGIAQQAIRTGKSVQMLDVTTIPRTLDSLDFRAKPERIDKWASVDLLVLDNFASGTICVPRSRETMADAVTNLISRRHQRDLPILGITHLTKEGFATAWPSLTRYVGEFAWVETRSPDEVKPAGSGGF